MKVENVLQKPFFLIFIEMETVKLMSQFGLYLIVWEGLSQKDMRKH